MLDPISPSWSGTKDSGATIYDSDKFRLGPFRSAPYKHDIPDWSGEKPGGHYEHVPSCLSTCIPMQGSILQLLKLMFGFIYGGQI